MASSWWHKLLGGKSKGRSHRRRLTDRPQWRSALLGAETLEDRTMPSAVLYVEAPSAYTPSNPTGGETVTWNPGSGNSFSLGGSISGLIYGTTAFGTIQDAIKNASSGATIDVAPGTYAEDITISTPITLNGAQMGSSVTTRFTSFVTGADGPKANPAVESVITTPVDNATGDDPSMGVTANDLVRVLTNNTTVNGFVIDGNNPALDSGGDLTGPNGVDIQARRGIINQDTTDATHDVNNLTIEYNIIQNFAQRGIQLNSDTNTSTGNVITQNLVRNFGADDITETVCDGIVLFENCYANVTNNTITDDVGDGNVTDLQLQNFNNPGTMTWSGNTVIVGQDDVGICANNYFASSGTLNIDNNTVNAAAGVTSTDDYTWGIYVLSVQVGSTVSLSGNIIGSSGGEFARGIDLWNDPTTDTVTITGGTIADTAVGIEFQSADPLFQEPGGATTISVSNLGITAATTGVFIDGDTVTNFFSGTTDPTASISASLTNVTVSGPTTGLLVEGFSSTITATATLSGDTISGSTTGAKVGAYATLNGSSTINGPLNVCGTVSPGSSFGSTGIGQFTTGAVTFNSGSVYDVDLNGTTPGTGYDQISSSGALAIATTGTIPVLNVSLGSGFTPALNSTYTIIHASSVTGAFANLAPNAILEAGGFLFKISYTGGNVVLTRAQTQVTASITASNKYYDGTTAAYISNVTLMGVLPGDMGNVGATASAANFSSANVGTFTVTATGLTLTGSAAGNYVLASTTATTTATINAATITLSAVTDTKVYDGTTSDSKTPNFQVTSYNSNLGESELPANTLYNSDHFTTLSQSFNSPTVAGATTLTPSGTIGANYQVTATNTAPGSITPASLTVTVISDLMLMGNNVPPLSGTYNGTHFTGSITITTSQGDSITIALSTLANSSSPVGQYAITPTVSGSASGNYIITSSPGTLYVVTIGNETSTNPNTVFYYRGGDSSNPYTWITAQLTNMKQNVNAGYMKTTDVVYAGSLVPYIGSGFSTAGLDAGGFLTIASLEALANAAIVTYANPANRTTAFLNYMNAIAQAMQNANDNTSFVQQMVPPGI